MKEITWGELLRAEESLGPPPREWCVVVHPRVWNGYWSIRQRSLFLRRLGRKIHSRAIYSLGLRVEWITGLKDVLNDF